MIPLTIKINDLDNVAVVANANGLPAGTRLNSGLILKQDIPQAHKVALIDIQENSAVIRYGIPIGYAIKNITAGC